jgi:very-short-patch-repair endonuclease
MAAEPVEAALWKRLEANQLGVEFQLRPRVLGYVAQFYCPAAKLVVEVESADGASARKPAAGRAAKWRSLVVLQLPAGMTVEDMVARIDRKLVFLQVERQPATNQPEQDKPSKAA